MLNEFSQLEDVNRQKVFLLKYIEQGVMLQYRYPRRQNKELNNSYNCIINNNKHRVCKLFFKNTIRIKERPTRTVISRINENGFIEAHKRGQHNNHKKLKVILNKVFGITKI